jgi:antitoxin component of MazEF toxin-antitoxin module
LVILCLIHLRGKEQRMRIERELKKVGGSVMVPIPAEILRELRWEPGLRVVVDSEGGGIRVEPVAERPPDDIAEFVARFTKKYDQALRNLSER